VYIGNTYGSGAGPIWLDDLQCTGSEESFDDCTHRGWGVHNCHHYEDVSILCADGGMLQESVIPIPVGLFPLLLLLRLLLLLLRLNEMSHWASLRS